MIRALLCIFFIALSANAQSAEETSPVRVCFERWWPFSYVDENLQAHGIVVDLVRYASQTLKREVEFEELPYKRCVDDVRSGRRDFTLHVDKTDKLKMINETLASWDLTFAVRKGEFTSLEEMKKAKRLQLMIAEEYDYPDAVYEKLDAMGHRIIKRSYYETTDEDANTFFALLINRRVDAILVDQRWAKKMIIKNHINVALLDDLLHSEPQFIGYIESRASLGEELGRALATIPGKVKQEISQRYQ